MTVELQKELAQRMGLLTGKPSTSGLHIFPLMHTTKQIDDKEVTVISDQGGKSKDTKEATAKPRLRLQDPSVSDIELNTNKSSLCSLWVQTNPKKFLLVLLSSNITQAGLLTKAV